MTNITPYYPTLRRRFALNAPKKQEESRQALPQLQESFGMDRHLECPPGGQELGTTVQDRAKMSVLHLSLM